LAVVFAEAPNLFRGNGTSDDVSDDAPKTWSNSDGKTNAILNKQYMNLCPTYNALPAG
jgi:hypothetical protein